jgi:molybdopterin converting factor small subunit
MRVRFLLFASYRDLAGHDQIEVELSPGASAAEAVQVLRGTAPRLARLPVRPSIAVNEEYVALETLLRDGDEVALLPPVAGG